MAYCLCDECVCDFEFTHKETKQSEMRAGNARAICGTAVDD